MNIFWSILTTSLLSGVSCVSSLHAQETASPVLHKDVTVLCSDNKFARPLGEVIDEIGKRFKVRIKYNVDTAGLVLPYADSRIRPYSVEESLTNVLAYFDYKWVKQGNNTYKIKPYEYPRRQDADGEKLIAYLNTLYDDSIAFNRRRDILKREFRERVGIDPLLAKCVSDAGYRNVTLGKIRKKDGYSVQNFSMETLPGLYVCGSIYAPSKKEVRSVANRGQFPLIVCPNGHFAEGRYNEALQQRMAVLARMGAICVGWDLFGWGESELQVGIDAHHLAVAQPLQLMNGLKIFDWLLATRKDVDHDRLAVNGGSGGGTACVMLTVLDDRFTASCPVVSFCSHFDGGCPCESGMGTSLCGGGTCNAEYAALFAPKPMACVSDEGDWTHTVPYLEYPYLQRVYSFYGAENKVANYHLLNERHDFGLNKRKSVYDFFVKVFGLDSTRCDESKVEVESAEALKMYGSKETLPQGAITKVEDFQNLLK